MKEETERWLASADEDLGHAEFMLQGLRPGPAGFFAQQAAEKALKALLIERQERFPRLHDLVILARELKAPESMRSVLADLTVAYTQARYPEFDAALTVAQAQVLVRGEEEVLGWVRRQV